MAFKLGQKPTNPVINAQNNNHDLIKGSTKSIIYGNGGGNNWQNSMMNINSPQYKATLKKEPDASSVVGTNPREQLNKELGLPKNTPPSVDNSHYGVTNKDIKVPKYKGPAPMSESELFNQRFNKGYGGITTGAANLAATEGGESILNWFPVSGEIIDAKNTAKDLGRGDYSGAAMNAAGFMLPFIPGGFIKKLLGKSDSRLPTPTSNPIVNVQKEHIKRSGVDEFGVPRNFKEGVKPDQFGGNRPAWNDYGEELRTSVGGKSKKLDEFMEANPDWNTSTENFKYLGNQGGRDMIEFNSPAGNQVFYRSSGRGGKAGSAGSYVPFEGYQNLPGTKQWFMKEGSEGTFGGVPMKTIHLDKNHPRYKKGDRSVSVRQQLEEMDVDPMEALRKGDLKLNKPGYDFNYTNNPDSKIHQIASGLEKIEDKIIYGPVKARK